MMGKDHSTIQWSMADLAGATLLEKTDLPSPRCHQLPIVPQLWGGVGEHGAPPHFWLEYRLTASCTGPML